MRSFLCHLWTLLFCYLSHAPSNFTSRWVSIDFSPRMSRERELNSCVISRYMCCVVLYTILQLLLCVMCEELYGASVYEASARRFQRYGSLTLSRRRSTQSRDELPFDALPDDNEDPRRTREWRGYTIAGTAHFYSLGFAREFHGQ